MLMKIKQFKYKKKNSEEVKDYNLLILNENEKYIAGISLGNLTPEQVEELKKIQMDYEAKLQSFMTSYRQFITEGIVAE